MAMWHLKKGSHLFPFNSWLSTEELGFKKQSLARLIHFSSMLFWPKFWKPLSLISLATASAYSSLKSVNPYIYIFKIWPVFLHVAEPIGGLLTFVKVIYYF